MAYFTILSNNYFSAKDNPPKMADIEPRADLGFRGNINAKFK
jgi:hypothetical protein